MNIFTTKKYLFLCLLLTVSFSSIGNEAVIRQTLDTTTAVAPHQIGLIHATSDLVARAKGVTHAEQLSYYEQLTDDKGNSLTRYHNPNLPRGDRWQKLEVIGEDISQSELQIDIPMLLSPSLMTLQQPVFQRENKQFWIFAIKTSVNAENEGRRSGKLEEAANKLQSNLNTFIYVDKHTQLFARLEIVNAEPFKPSTLAKIESFSVIVDYAAAWGAGPLVAISSVRKLKGSYGLFINIDEQLNQQLSQFSFIP